ncbi:MAG: hypothetical protein J6O73_14880 [Lachnospiraceae bacterium]|nr:hypothetical protein [Lachnospiraceae bacterium]
MMKNPVTTMLNRAAQFAPFAALSGYEESVRETERLTDRRIEPDEAVIAELNDKLQYLYLTRSSPPHVTITYFVKDPRKDGGSYETISCTIKNIDAVFAYVVMDDGSLVPIKDICAIEM